MSTPKRRIIPIFIPHSGCTHECVFCNQNRISGALAPAISSDVQKIFFTATEHIKHEDIDTYEIEIAFYGGSFTALPEVQQNDLLCTAHELLSNFPHGAIRLSTRPDCVDQVTVLRLKKYGVSTIELGAQSMCDEVLALSRRGHTSNDVKTASQIIKSAGIALVIQMMTGLPGDDFDKSVYTARQISSLKPDGVRIYPTVVVSDTKLYEMYCTGSYKEHSVKEAVALCQVLALIFEDAQIPIIRLGLNPTDELSGGQAVAGAYHPSFGELVYSGILYHIVAAQLQDIPKDSDIEIIVPQGQTSKMIGQHRCNMIALQKEFCIRSVQVIEAADLFKLSDTKTRRVN